MIGALFVVVVLPAVVAVTAFTAAARTEDEPPQSTYDDARDVGRAVETLGRLGTVPFPADLEALRAVSSQTLGIGAGNTVGITGSYEEFCVSVSHEGAETLRYDSVWGAVQTGTSPTGACS